MRRALHRASTHSVSLVAIEPTSAFPRDGWAYLVARVGSERAQACATELLASVIEQLCGVIGADLTYRLVDRARDELRGSHARSSYDAHTHED
jgi:hypothetical protein